MSEATVATPEYVDAFPEATEKAQSLLGKVAESIVSLTDACKALAVVIVDIRAGVEREVTSKKTGKKVTVPDWDGRSDEYQSWYRLIFRPMLEKLIPTDEQRRLEQRIQNAVQIEWKLKTRSKDAQLAHLGLTRQTKGQTQNEKRNGEKEAANGRKTEEVFSVDSLATFVNEMPDPQKEGETLSRPVREAAAGIVAMAHALEDRTSAGSFEIGNAERKATDAYLVQALGHLARTRLHIGAVETIEEALAEIAAGSSIEVAA